MKIDSDVQDIFGQHQKGSKSTGKAAAGLSSTLGQSGNQMGQLMEQQQQWQQQQGWQHQPQQQQQQQQQDTSMDLLRRLTATQSGQTLPNLQQQPALAQLQEMLGLAASAPEGGAGGGEDVRAAISILEDIVSLSEQYVNISPQVPESPVTTSIVSLLKLIVSLGKDHIRAQRQQLEQHRRQQEEQRAGRQDPPAPFLQELLLSLTQRINQQSAQQQVQPAAGLAGDQRIAQAGSQQQQQQQQQQNNGLQDLMAQARAISSLNGVPISNELLRQLQQLQQNQRK